MGIQESITKRSYAKVFDSFTYTPITIERTAEYRHHHGDTVVSAPLLKTAYHGVWSMFFTKGLGPISRLRHCWVYNYENDELVIAYGTDANNMALNDAWALSFKTNTWRCINQALKGPRHSASSVLLGEKMFIFGGYNDHSYFADLHYINIFTGVVFDVMSYGVTPSPRITPVMHKVNDMQMVLWGGYCNNVVDDSLYVYNIRDDKWNETPNFQTNRPFPSYCTYSDNLYVFGSTKGHALIKFSNKFFEFESIDCTGVEPPRDLTLSSLIGADEFIFLIGGESTSQFMHIYAYDVKKRWWFAFHVRPDSQTLSLMDGYVNEIGLFMLPREFSSSLVYREQTRELVSVMGSRIMSPQPIFKIEIGTALGVLHLRNDMFECFHNTYK